MKIKITLAAICLVLIGACTPRPNSISPVSMTGAFDNLSCNQAITELNAERQNLAKLEKEQNGAATADAIGVFFVLLPVSKITGGDKAGEVAESKGRVIALEQRISSCR